MRVGGDLLIESKEDIDDKVYDEASVHNGWYEVNAREPQHVNVEDFPPKLLDMTSSNHVHKICVSRIVLILELS